MKRLILAILPLALGASACTATAGLPGPAAISDRTKLDERIGQGVETIYTAAARAGALAFRAGIVKPSSDPAVQTGDFCPRVMAGTYSPTDRGSKVMTLECRLRAVRDGTRAAYDAANAATYEEGLTRATALGKELLALIGD